MKKFFLLIFVIVISHSGQAQEKFFSIDESTNQTVDDYIFLYNYFNTLSLKSEESEKMVKKTWQEYQAGMRMVVFINLTTQTLDVIDMSGVFRIALADTVSTGMKAHPTPVGNWKICNKKVNFWSTTWKCNMTHWNGLIGVNSFGIHGLEGHSYEKQLGKAVSHGCIRMRKSNEKFFYDFVPIGTKVVIYGRPPWETYGNKK